MFKNILNFLKENRQDTIGIIVMLGVTVSLLTIRYISYFATM